jgi:hypothetical protein
MNTLTLGFPAKSQVNAVFMMSLMNSLPALKAQSNYAIQVKELLGKSNLPHARSILVTEWYDQAKEGDLFMFIDTDHTFTENEILRVIRQNGDLRAGIYGNKAGFPTSIPEGGAFQGSDNCPIRFAATGFLCFTYHAARTIHERMKALEGLDRVVISDNNPRENSVIPFFQPILTRLESGKIYWLGEDFSFSHRAKQAGLTIVGALTTNLGHEIPTLAYFRPPTRWGPKSIVYYCGNSRVEFSPLDTKLGGSEQAVVYLSAALHAQGYHVTVFGNVKAGCYNGVVYRTHSDFSCADDFSTLILWRRYGLEALPNIKQAKRLLVDLHDPTDPKYLTPELMSKVSSVMVKSNFHRSLYRSLPDSLFRIQPNGLVLDKLSPSIKPTRDPTRFCYTSSYDRGLIPLLRYTWPLIKAAIPEATFHIHYGSELLPPQVLSELVPLLKSDGVYEHGRSSYNEVVLERCRSVIQLYLTSTPLEIDCLSVREAAYLGCIPILSKYAVFSERAGIHIDGDPQLESTHQTTASTAISISRMTEDKREVLVKALQEESLKLTWMEVAAKWPVA